MSGRNKIAVPLWATPLALIIGCIGVCSGSNPQTIAVAQRYDDKAAIGGATLPPRAPAALEPIGPPRSAPKSYPRSTSEKRTSGDTSSGYSRSAEPRRSAGRRGLPRGLDIEFQAKGGRYSTMLPEGGGNSRSIQEGERLRWKYPRDNEWRVLEAYGATQVSFNSSHYEISGDFFHSFRDKNRQVQVPTLSEARKRRDTPRVISQHRENIRFFAEVDTSAPKAPPPDGNCAVWQKGKLWLNDQVSGSVDSIVGGEGVDQLSVETMTPGMIFVLVPPSQILAYAVTVDFEAEIYAEIGRKRGLADAEAHRIGTLLQLAKSPEEAAWCNARVAYEQGESVFWEQRLQMYNHFLEGQLDSFALIRSGHPIPHVQLASVFYRHENVELSVGVFSDYQGRCVLPANAFLWINDSIPPGATPFSLEILDQSDPPFLGSDTRFRTEGDTLLAEEKTKGTGTWVARDPVVDVYRYARFSPPQPGGPPVYLVDVTADISGALKRLNREGPTSFRMGTIQLTPDQIRIDLQPQALPVPARMDSIVTDILMEPLDIRGWVSARRRRLREVFEKAPVLPDAVLDVFEEAVDELALRVYEIEGSSRAAGGGYRFKPTRVSMTLSRTPQPGEMALEMVMSNKEGKSASVVRTVRPEIDVLDFAARSVALNRSKARIQDFRPMTRQNWLSMLGQTRTANANR